MALKTIYIARHGFRSNWLPPPHPPNPTGIDSDPVLAPHGVEQAKQLAKHISELPDAEKPQFLLSLPFYRCLETSQPISQALGLRIHIDCGVGEWFKPTREVIPVPAKYDALREFFPNHLGDEVTWEGSGVVPSALGEDEEAIFERCRQFWAAFIPRFEAKYPEIETLLIVTHAAAKIALGMSLLKQKSVHDEIVVLGEKTKIRSGACSLDKFVLGLDWELVQNGRTDFLTGGEEMNWNFDVKVEAGSDEDIKARKEAAEREKAAEIESAEADGLEEDEEMEDGEEQIGEEVEEERNKEDYEEVYFAIDIPVMALSLYEEPARDLRDSQAFGEQLLINPGAKLQVTELNHASPLFKISDNANAGADPESVHFTNLSAVDGQIFRSSWTRLQGTELVFNDDGEVVATLDEHLVADNNVKVKPKTETLRAVPEKETGDMRTGFLRQALAAAKSKAG